MKDNLGRYKFMDIVYIWVSDFKFENNGIYYLLEAEIPNSGSWWIENSVFQILLNGGEFIKQEYTFEPRKCVKELRLI
jgi:hypothetical protein